MNRGLIAKLYALVHLGLLLAPSAMAQAGAQTFDAQPYTDAQAYAQAQAAITANLSGPIAMAAGSTIGGVGVPTPLGSVPNVSGLTYLHHYPSATMTVPAVGVGAIGTGTIVISTGTVPAVGDLCLIAPTAPTTALNYMIGTGWVTTAGTIKVALEAGTLVAITAGTLGVNVLCGQ